MLDPGFDPELFVPDRVVGRKTLLGLGDLARREGACFRGDSACFRSVDRLEISLQPKTPDLSGFNSLSIIVFNHADGHLLADMKLVHECSSPMDEKPGMSLSGGREDLPPRRWVELKFPTESFGVYGTPKGWTDIREIQVLFGREKGMSTAEEIEVSVRSLDGEFRLRPVGPRLTDAGLARVLERDIPGITDLFSGQGSMEPTSCSPRANSLEPYLPGNIGLFIPPPHPYPVETARDILTGLVMGQRLGHPIPWDANPVGELEWGHFLSRHHFMRELVKVLAGSVNKELKADCARALDTMVESWMAANPVPIDSNGGAGQAWETLSAAWRLREWLWIIGVAWPHEAFRKTVKIKMLRSIWEHARSLMDHRGHPNNWIIVESAALVLAGLCFPEFREASEWRQEGIERLRIEFQRQFFHDGVHFEISPLYHSICVHALLEVRQAALIRGIALPDEFGVPLEKTLDYLVALCRPDFTWPSLNDSGSANRNYSALLRWAGQVCNRSFADWMRERRPRQTDLIQEFPDAGLTVFPDAGIAVMRSGYERDANQLVFRAGPAGAAHAHEDVLSLDVTAFGVPRLVDPGITAYAPDPWTDYYRSAAAHNLVLIDGTGPDAARLSYSEKIRPAGSDVFWTSADSLEIVTGVYRGGWKGIEGQYLVARTVVFVAREYWIVRDVIAGKGTHELTTCWQFQPGRVDVDIETNAVRCVDARGPRFDLIPLTDTPRFHIEVYTGASRPLRGWISLNGADMPATTILYSFAAELPKSIMWLLLPFRGRPDSGFKTNRATTTEDGLTIELEFKSGRRDSVQIPVRHAHGVVGQQVTPDTQSESDLI